MRRRRTEASVGRRRRAEATGPSGQQLPASPGRRACGVGCCPVPLFNTGGHFSFRVVWGHVWTIREAKDYIGAKKIERDGNDRRAQGVPGVPGERGWRGTSWIRAKSGEARLGQLEAMLVLEPSGSILAWIWTLYCLCGSDLSGFVFPSAKRRVFLFDRVIAGVKGEDVWRAQHNCGHLILPPPPF